jgi:hypothetical protein
MHGFLPYFSQEDSFSISRNVAGVIVSLRSVAYQLREWRNIIF